MSAYTPEACLDVCSGVEVLEGVERARNQFERSVQGKITHVTFDEVQLAALGFGQFFTQFFTQVFSKGIREGSQDRCWAGWERKERGQS